jgi:hypothetical protein
MKRARRPKLPKPPSSTPLTDEEKADGFKTLGRIMAHIEERQKNADALLAAFEQALTRRR